MAAKKKKPTKKRTRNKPRHRFGELLTPKDCRVTDGALVDGGEVEWEPEDRKRSRRDAKT